MTNGIKLLLTTAVLGGLIFSACSLIGLGIGAAVDSGKKTTLSGWQIKSIQEGERLTVYCSDRATIKGRYKGAAKANPAVDTAFTVLLMETSRNQITEVPIASVEKMVLPGKSNTGKIAGFGLGLTLDALMIATVLELDAGVRFDPQSVSSGGSSCPLFCSFDGNDYRPDAEMFGGAIFKAAERPDWDNLDFLRETDDGRYRLKMINAFEETQEVDFVKLLVVDHPAGSRVYPSFEGKLYALTNPQAPRKAHTFSGLDVRDDIRRVDGSYWLSNPFNRDLDNPKDLRDGLILEFDRPAHVTSAALLLNVQNTLWGSVLQKEMLKLQGRNLPNWYDMLNESEQARRELMNAMVREGMLSVSVWGNSCWRPAGHVWEVGSNVAKDLVLKLDLEDFQSDKLRIKLEGPPGIWMLNSAQVDFSFFNVPLEVQELDLYKAIDQNGNDVSLALLNADDLYYAMPDTKDVVFMEFKAPARKPGMNRSFVLKSGGYYTIHLPAEGEPQTGRFREMLTVPGAFTRYGLEFLYRQVTEGPQPGQIVL